jgi:hypothetical protein
MAIQSPTSLTPQARPKNPPDPVPVQPGRPGGGPPVSKPIPAGQDLTALFSTGSEGPAPSLSPPATPQRSDLSRAAALLDELMILFHQMSGEAKKVNAEASWQQMHLAQEQSLKAAGLKEDAAGTTRILGYVSLGVGIAGAALTVGGPVVSLLSSLASAGSSTVAEAAKETGKEVTKTVVKEVVAKMSQEISKQVAEKLIKEASEEAAKKVAEEVAKEVAKKVAEEVTKEVAKQVGQSVSQKLGAEIAKEVGLKVGQEIAEQVGQEVAQKVAGEVTAKIGQEVAAKLGQTFAQELGKTVTETLGQSVAKEAGSAMVKALGQGWLARIASQVIANPNTAKLVTDTFGQTSQSLGQADVQTTQAEGDRLNAQAQETMGEKQRSDQFVDDFRELMKKMNQLINDLLAAKNQSEAAAAKA